MDYARLRIALNRARPYTPAGQQVLKDEFTGQTPIIGFGRPLQIELLVTNSGVGGAEGVIDISGITSITAQLRPAANGVIDATVAADIFNRSTGALYTITQDAWTNDSGVPSYHAAVQFTGAEMGALAGLTFGTDNIAPAGLVFLGTTVQGLVPLGAGIIKVFKDGGTGPGSGVAPTAAWTLTNDQINGMVQSRLAAGENAAGVDFTLRGPNGWGIRFFIDDSVPGSPVLQETIVPPLP